jgi:hypothetical protein
MVSYNLISMCHLFSPWSSRYPMVDGIHSQAFEIRCYDHSSVPRYLKSL